MTAVMFVTSKEIREDKSTKTMDSSTKRDTSTTTPLNTSNTSITTTTDATAIPIGNAPAICDTASIASITSNMRLDVSFETGDLKVDRCASDAGATHVHVKPAETEAASMIPGPVSRSRTHPGSRRFSPSPVEVNMDIAMAAAEEATEGLSTPTGTDKLGAETGTEEPPMTRAETSDDLFPGARAFSDLSNPRRIRELCLACVPEWSHLTLEDLRVNQLMAGLSNQLFKVSVDPTRENVLKENPTRNRVLFRVYGKDCDVLYDTSAELQNFSALSEKNIAPELIATFVGGRIEEWIEGAPLLVEDMGRKRTLAGLATILAGLHSLDMSDVVEPTLVAEPALFRILNRWIVAASEVMNNAHEHTPTLLDLHRLNVPKLVKEAENLKALLFPPYAEYTPLVDIVFCHNDLQENNIMVSTRGLRLIDFEFSAYNYPAYDFACYNWEMSCDYCYPRYPFFRVDNSKLPREDQQRFMLAVYLSRRLHRNVSVSSPETTAALHAVQRFGLAAHLIWIFWGIIRAPQAPTVNDFDMLYYAQKRADCYWRLKRKLVNEGITSDWLPKPEDVLKA